MNEQTVSAEQVFRLLRRNFSMFCLTFLAIVAISVLVAFVLPKKYKALSELSIQGSYFKNPLVNDLISEVHDQSELSAQRSSLIRLALNKDFLDELGEKYNYFDYPRDHRLRGFERKLLLDDIEYFPMGSTSFQISVISKGQTTSYEMTKDVLTQIIRTLISEREKKLLTTQTAIQGHLKILSATLRDLSKPAQFKQPEMLEAELKNIKGSLTALLTQYTERHPAVVQLRARERAIQQRLKQTGAPAKKASSEKGDSFVIPDAKEPLQDVYKDLLKKSNYLNVVIDMESDAENLTHLAIIKKPVVPTLAFFPNKKLIILFGFVAGALVSATLVLVAEFRRGTFTSPTYISESLEVPFFGELPKLEHAEATLLLDDPTHPALRPRLTASTSEG